MGGVHTWINCRHSETRERFPFLVRVDVCEPNSLTLMCNKTTKLRRSGLSSVAEVFTLRTQQTRQLEQIDLAFPAWQQAQKVAFQ